MSERATRSPSVAVAVVSHDSVPAMFAYDLGGMMAYSMAALPEDTPLGLNWISGTYVHGARQEMLEALLAQGVDYILWIDADMRFPKDALVRLMMHNKDVVGCNYAKRRVPTDYVGLKVVGDDETIGSKLVTNAESTGLEEVGALGFGLLLMKTSALQALPKGEPWFWYEWMERRKQMVGEDVFFCNLLRKLGVKIYVDHDLSNQLAHIGSFEYKLSHVEAQREASQA